MLTPKLSRLHHSRLLLLLLTLLFLTSLAKAEDWIYRIRPGENLSVISERYLSAEITPAQLQSHNHIEQDRDIPIGTEIRIPLEWLQQAPAGVQVVFLRGDVSLFRNGVTDSRLLGTDDILKAGDRVVTGPYAVLSLRFADGSRLLLGPDSEVGLDTISAYGQTGMVDTRLRVQRGRLENRVKPLGGEGSRYEIHTPAAVTMVRGTGFRVAVEAVTGLTRNEVFEGGVAVSAGGETLAVVAGFGTLIEPGKAPTAPSKLLDAADLSGLPRQVDAGDVDLTWPVLGGAVEYRLQLLEAEQDDAVLVDARVPEPNYQLVGLSSGSYRLRLRGIDELGLEGLSAEHALQVNQPPPEPEPLPVIPEPPPAVEPTQLPAARPVLENPMFGPGWIGFRWNRVADAWGYRFLLAREETFRDPLFENIGMNTTLQLPMHWRGRLFIRVDALFQEDDADTQSDIYRIEIPGH